MHYISTLKAYLVFLCAKDQNVSLHSLKILTSILVLLGVFMRQVLSDL